MTARVRGLGMLSPRDCDAPGIGGAIGVLVSRCLAMNINTEDPRSTVDIRGNQMVEGREKDDGSEVRKRRSRRNSSDDWTREAGPLWAGQAQPTSVRKVPFGGHSQGNPALKQ